MGREKRILPAAVVGGPKERHRRAQRSQYDPTAPVPEGFVAKPTAPKTKYQSYFEFVENTDKKKKLEFQVTSKKSPPPGFDFVPIGNPELTSACKELSREKDAMIFIVSNARDIDAATITSQVHRVGHHVRQTIVEEARAKLQQPATVGAADANGLPEPIPDSQEEYNLQVDAAIRDLFPRIPNTDRQEIIEHAFTKRPTLKKEAPVGLSADIPLARRVQLAVLAHIRHNHTRYDMLLKETSWQNARKVVESLCLDILVKWRGDEETGRDQLDEILREVVIISDTEDDDDKDDPDDASMGDAASIAERHSPTPQTLLSSAMRQGSPRPETTTHEATLGFEPNERHARPNRLADKRGFKRYRAWNEALRRNQTGEAQFQLDHGNHESYPQDRFLEQVPSSSQPHPRTLDLRPVDAPQGSVNAVLHPPGIRYSSARTLPTSVSTHPPYPQAISMAHETRGNDHPVQVPVSPVGNGFQDLLVRSIEPVSPDAPQSYYIRTLPPRGFERLPHPALPSEMHQPMSSNPPPRELVAVPGASYPGRRVVSDHAWHENDTRHNFGNSPAYSSSLPRDQHRLPFQQGDLSGPSMPVSSSRLNGHETFPSRRIVIDAPRPGERSNPILMEDRGGYYERIPASTSLDVNNSMPAFVTIKRSMPEVDRIPHYPRSIPHESDPEGRFAPRPNLVSYERRPPAQPQPLRSVFVSPRNDEPHSEKTWIETAPINGHYPRGGVENIRYPAPPQDQSWAERSSYLAPAGAQRQFEPVPQSYHSIANQPPNENDATQRYYRPPRQEDIIVLD
ncbi:hypothetical protein HJFPF1_00424 [Paramyrothecium foliicola]|nr:hypothetical protein HJFPF1_00424 [Paramyrothecium foliicola]